MRFPLKLVATLASLTTPLAKIEAQELQRRSLPKRPRIQLMEIGVGEILQPRSCPSRIGIAKPGWRNDARKHRWKELSLRQRRNRRINR